jgi:hypothetical protein
MKKLLPLLLLSSTAFATTWTGVPLVDQQCSRKAAGDPDSHSKQCLMGCAGSGLGILTSDGKFLKLDKTGADQALAAVKQSDKKDHLRVTVDGEEKDGTIAVKSVKLD